MIEFCHCCECVQIVTICALLASRCLPGRQKRLGPRGIFIKKLFREHYGRRQGLWRLRSRLPKKNTTEEWRSAAGAGAGALLILQYAVEFLGVLSKKVHGVGEGGSAAEV